MLQRESLAQGSHHGVVAEALDGSDRSAIATASIGDAGPPRRPVDLDRAGPAHAPLAPDIGASQHQPAAQQIGKLLARLGQHLPWLAVHGERDRYFAQGALVILTARQSAVSPQPRRQAVS